jgi:hypothetical protein
MGARQKSAGTRYRQGAGFEEISTGKEIQFHVFISSF